MSSIKFKTNLKLVNNWTILHLPSSKSAMLPSRGMTMVEGKLNNIPFSTLLEPDGNYMSNQKPSHFFAPSKQLLKKAQAKAGDRVDVSLKPTKEWTEPEIPKDIKNALNSSKKAQYLWNDITPLARWDWIRWVRAVKTQETRQKHIQVMLDKLNKGERRPCCFNRALCSQPEISKNWRLLD